MKKDHSVRNAYLVYALLVLYIIARLAADYGIGILEKSDAVNALSVYSDPTGLGVLRFNLIPLRNLVSLAMGGHLATALLIRLGRMAVQIPLGIFLPILYSRFRTLPGVLIFPVAIRVLRGSRVLRRTSGVTVMEIDTLIFLLLGVVIGFLIWKRWINNRIDVSRASLG